MSRRREPKSKRRQRGIALLLAILLVAIATILASAIGYGSAMGARRGAAAIAFDEGLLVGQAAEALAAYGLREDLRAGADFDYPGEAWAKPVGPIEIAPGVQLEASLEDLQGASTSIVSWDRTASRTPSQYASSSACSRWWVLSPNGRS